MKRFGTQVALSLTLLLIVPALSWAAGIHYFNCTECHKSSYSVSNLATANVCLSCHAAGTYTDNSPAPGRDGIIEGKLSASQASDALGSNPYSPTGYGTSHIWGSSANNAAAGAQEPATNLTGFYRRYQVSWGKVTCTRCHEPHAETGTNDLALNPDALNGNLPMTSEQLCRACHVPFDQQNNKGLVTHPVVVNYDALLATPPYQTGGAKEGWLQPTIGNGGVSGTVQGLNDTIRTGSPATYVNGVGCISCHGVHAADSDSTTADGFGTAAATADGDGKLLRADGATRTGADSAATAQRRSNLCQACHTFKTHGSSGTQMGCLDCHSGHTYGSSNYFVLRNQVGATTGLNYSSLTPLHGGSTSVAQVWSGTVPGDTAGYCERCHGQLTAMPGSARVHNEVADANCRTCHAHDGATYSFEAVGGCDGCHGSPPTTNTLGGPTGYAAGYTPFKDESVTPHAAHAAGGSNYTFNCSVCHLNNNHDNGSFQDVFLGADDPLATGSGQMSPTFNGSGGSTCSAVYCHSNGGARTSDAARTFVAATIPAWQNGAGTITTCNACHDNSNSMTNGSPAHAAHLAVTGITCKTCHVTTADSATALAAGAIGTTHVNNMRDVAFDTSGFISVGTTPYNASTGACMVYCHSDGMGFTEVQPDWDVATTGDCGSCHVVTTDGNCLGGAHETHLKQFVIIFGGTEPDQCVRCHDHDGTAFGGQHINGVVDAPTSAAQINTKCNPCHGATLGGTGDDAPPVWSGSITCTGCHAGSVTAVINGKTTSAKNLANVSGHNKPSGSYNVSGNSAAVQQCASCHDSSAAGHFDGITGDDMRLLPVAATCTTSCHGVGGSAVKDGIVTHQAYNCSACHDPHGTSNIYMVKGTSAPYSGTVVFTATTGADSYDEVDSGNADDVCATCHTASNQTNQHNNKTNTGVAHNEGTDCFTCHKAHTNPTVDGGAFATGAGSSCNGCHGFPPATGAHRTGTSLSDFELHSTTSLNTMAEDRTDCATCHTGADSYTYNPTADRGNSLNHGNASGRRTILTTTVGYNSTDKNCTTACHVSTVGNGGAWNATTGLSCNACHYYSAAPTSAGNAGNLGGDHDAHFGTGGVVTCDNCHVVDNGGAALSGPLTHITTAASGTHATRIQGRAVAEQDEAAVTTAALGLAGSDPDPGAPTCNNMACHNPSGTTYSVMWEVNTAGCDLCHSNTNPGSGSHGQHMTAVTNFGINTIACTSCHGTLPVSNAHRSGSVNLLAGMNYTPAALDVGGTVGTCNTTTCHNNGAATPVAVVTPTWGVPSADCSICHANPPATAKHAEHMANTTYVDGACVDCHTAPTATTHINGTRNLDAGKVVYTSATQTCTNNCHIANTTGDWTLGGALACTDCHGSGKVTTPALDRGWPPSQGAHAEHVGNTQYVTGANCTDCHNNNTTTHSTLNNVVTAALGTKISANPGNGSCTNSCHAAAQASDWTGGSAAITCVDCHAGTYIGGNNVAKGFNATPASGLHAVTPSVSGQRHDQNLAGGCAACHPNVMAQTTTHIKGTFTGDGSVPADRTAMGLAGIYTNGGSDNLGTCLTTCHVGREDWAHKWMATANYTSTTLSCQGCHGADLAASGLGNAGVTHRTVTVKHLTGTTYTCRDCHAIEGAGYTFTFGSTDWGGASNHGNDIIEINNTGTGYNQTTGYCESCHTSGAYNFSDTGWTINSVAGTAITTACGECHQGGVKPGSASGAHTAHNAGTTALVAGGAACTSCHGNNGGLGYQNTLAGSHGIGGTVNFAVTYSTAVRNDLTGTCSNASCHYSQTTPAWNTTNSTTCTSCHNDGSVAVPGAVAEAWPSKNKNGTARSDAHAAHVTNTAYVNDVDCTDCHGDNNPTHSNAFDGTVVVVGNNMSGYATGSGTCSTNACHGGATADFRDASPTITCTDCHVAGKIGGGANDRTSGLHNVVPSVTGVQHDDSFGTGGTCSSCHTTITAQGTHINGAFTGGNGQTTQMGLAAFYAQTADNTGTCATTTCHTGRDDWAHKWMATANYTNVTASCQGCHGADLAASGLGNAGVTHRTVTAKHNGVAVNYTCRDCHNIEGAGYTFTFGTQDWGAGSSHGDSQIQINNNTSPAINYNETTGYCEGCHTSGAYNFSDTGWTITKVAGTAITTTCGECHQGGVKPGSASGAHTAHNAGTAALVDGGTDCVPCHGNNGGLGFHNTTSGSHGIGGTVNFAVTYSTAVRNDLTGTCSNASCHYSQTTPAWNTTNSTTCTSCHNDGSVAVPGAVAEAWPSKNKNGTARSDAHAAHVTNTAYVNDVDCTDCHGDNNPTHSNAFDGTVVVVGTNMSGYATGAGTCSTNACHGGATADFRDASPTITCTDCHVAGKIGGGANDRTSGLHNVVPSVTGVQHDNSFGAGGTCSSCHTTITAQGTHINGAFTGGNGQTTQMGLAAFYAQTADNTGTCATTTCHTGQSDGWAHVWTNSAGYYTTSPSACNGCHGVALASANLGTTGVTHLAIDTQHNTGASYQCKDCHNLEAASGYTFTFGTTDWRPLDTLSTHGDGQIQVNSNDTGYDEGTGYCTNCHTNGAFNFADTGWTIALTAGDGISANCGSCHGYPPRPTDGRPAISVEAKGAHEKHVNHIAQRLSVTINADTDAFVGNQVCGVCHDVSTSATHSTGGGPRNILLPSTRRFGGSGPTYSGLFDTSSSVNPKSCSSLDCHYQTTPIWAPVGGQ